MPLMHIAIAQLLIRVSVVNIAPRRVVYNDY
jgi:hypothetical protein